MDLLFGVGFIAIFVGMFISAYETYDSENIIPLLRSVGLTMLGIVIITSMWSAIYALGPKVSFTYYDDTVQFPQPTQPIRQSSGIGYEQTITTVIQHIRTCIVDLKVSYDFLALPGTTSRVILDQSCDSVTDVTKIPVFVTVFGVYGIDVNSTVIMEGM